MLGSVPLSSKAISDDIILHGGVTEMEGLGIQTSVGVGILVGDCDLSSNITQTTTGIASFSGVSTQDANFTADSNAVRVLGTSGLGYEASFTKTTTGVATFVGTSTQDLNITKTTSGDILYEPLNKPFK